MPLELECAATYPNGGLTSRGVRDLVCGIALAALLSPVLGRG